MTVSHAFYVILRKNRQIRRPRCNIAKQDKMKFKKWCISTVDTVKEQPQQAGQPEKKGFFGFGKKKDSDETKATKE